MARKKRRTAAAAAPKPPPEEWLHAMSLDELRQLVAQCNERLQSLAKERDPFTHEEAIGVRLCTRSEIIEPTKAAVSCGKRLLTPRGFGQTLVRATSSTMRCSVASGRRTPSYAAT